MTIQGIQRATVVALAAFAASALSGTGNVIALPNDWSASDEVIWQLAIAGGTYSALTVIINGSLDGVNWFQVAKDVTFTTGAGGILGGKVNDTSSTTIFPIRPPFLQVVVSNGTVNTGAPVITVNGYVR